MQWEIVSVQRRKQWCCSVPAGVAEQLAYMLDSDFYMVFTSVHEVMIHNDKFVEPEDLQCVLRDTIREATPERDYLTSRIYQYNRETHKFICVTPLEKDEEIKI